MRITWLFLFPMLATAGVSGPVLGYVGAGDQVRVLPGIPGAAYVGETIDLSGVLAVSSERGYAVLSDGADVRIVRLGDRQELGRWPSSEAVLLSPRGAAAALVGEGVVRVLLHRPDHIAEGPELRLQPGSVPRAISDDGQAVAFTDDAGSVGIATSAGVKMTGATAAADIRFIADTRDLICTDTTQVWRIGADSSSLIAGAADGVVDARATDYLGARLIVADGRTRQLVVRDGDAPAYRVDLPCAPSGLGRLNASTLRIACEADTRIHIVHASPGGIRILAVPEGE